MTAPIAALALLLGFAAAAEPVEVLYAGSLTHLFERQLGPAFAAASGLTFQGEGKGSVAAANLIRDRVRAPDVFVSADPAVNATLPGLVAWWVPFARTELVLAWSPRSRFRKAFEAAARGERPWESILEEKGLRLGRTDPELDPKGYRTLWLFQLDEERTGDREEAFRILGAPDNPAQIFPEEQLVARLQAGQLDVGIFYLIEAVEAHLPHLRLPPEVNQGDPAQAARYARKTYASRKGTISRGAPILYTVAIPAGARHPQAAQAFVRYLLGPDGARLLGASGLLPVPHVVSGDASAVPAALRSELDR